MTAADRRPAVNEPLRAAVAVYTILLIPRMLMPLLRWAGADAQLLGWLHIVLDYGQLMLLVAWWTRRAAPAVRITAVVWAAGVIVLAIRAPHISTYTLVYAGQAATVVAVTRQALASGSTRGLLGRSRPVMDTSIFLAAFPMMVLSSLAAQILWDAWPPPGSGGHDQLALIGIDTLGKAIVRMMVTSVLEEAASDLLVTGLLRRGARLEPICVISAAVRIAYHTYMGVSAVPIALVACSMVVLYCCYGRLLPLILAHEYFDLATLLPGSDLLLWTAAGAGGLVTYTVVVAFLVRRFDQRRSRGDLDELTRLGAYQVVR